METERRQIDYLRQFFNVEKIIGKGAFGQVLATSPIQNQPQQSPLRTTTAHIHTAAQSPTPPDSTASSTSLSSTFSNCNTNTATIITTTATASLSSNNLRYNHKADKPDGTLKRFAVKCTLPVIRPQRLASELRHLRDLGGKCNVVQLHTAQLHKGSLFIVMDLIDHERFSKIVTDMDNEEIAMYMKNLLIALQHVHSRNIMHRDIKPGNFLYNRRQRKFLLVDFGLATKVNFKPTSSGSLDPNTSLQVAYSNLASKPAAPCTPTRRLLDGVSTGVPGVSSGLMASPRTPTANRHLLGSNLFPETDQKAKMIPNTPYIKNISPAKQMNFGSPLANHSSTKRSHNETNDSIQMLKKLRVSGNDEHREPVKLTVGAYESPVTTNDGSAIVARQQMNQDHHKFSTPKIPRHPRCFCCGRPKTCESCRSRPEPNAPKSGTPGYKAPETLLRYPYQGTPIDIWSAGVIMFCLLSGHGVIFRDVDDMTSLCEIITLFGSNIIKDAAKELGIRLNVSPERPGHDLRNICSKIRSMKKECDPKVIIPDDAYDLLRRMLEPSPYNRITASEALQHPWLNPASPSYYKAQ